MDSVLSTALSFLWTPLIPSASERHPSLLDIVGVWEAPLALLGFGLGVVVLRLNPQRPLNRYLSLALIVDASWQSLFFLALRVHPGLPYLRASVSVGIAAVVCLTLIRDCIDWPVSSPVSRFRRQKWILLVCFLALCVPMTKWWIPFNTTPEHPLLGPLHPFVALVMLLVPCWLSIRAFADFKRAAPVQQIELQLFGALTFAATLSAAIMMMARHYDRSLAHLGSVLFGSCYVFGAWMLASPRAISPREVGLTFSQHAINIALLLVLAVSVLILGSSLTVGQLAVGLIVIIYPGGRVFNWITNRWFRRTSDPVYDSLRKKILELVGTEWVESRLNAQFCGAVAEHLGAGSVEAWNSGELTSGKVLSQARRVLLAAATTHGWLTTGSAHRNLQPAQQRAVMAAFESEEISLVVVDSSPNASWTLVIGKQSSLRAFTEPQIRFLAEMLTLLRGASERIRLAGKVVHNDRLATVGFLASQIRHEDRNRLDSIRAGIELLKLGRERDLNQEHRDLLFQTVEEFVHDFNLSLDLARSDLGHIEVASAHAVILNSVGVFTPFAQRRKVTIETFFTKGPDSVKIDQRLVRQVLLNLLKNSAEATESTGDSRITLTTSTSDNVFLIEVADNGPGVPQGIHNQLFSDFCTTKPTGTGLGLSICRDALSLMNGTIHYMTPRGGPHARFVIGVPMATEGLPIAPGGGCSLPGFGL